MGTFDSENVQSLHRKRKNLKGKPGEKYLQHLQPTKAIIPEKWANSLPRDPESNEEQGMKHAWPYRQPGMCTAKLPGVTIHLPGQQYLKIL